MKTQDAGRLSVREYEKLSYRDLGEDGARRLETLSERLGVELFRFGRKAATARQYVGVVRAGSLSIEILPKLYELRGDNLSFLVFLLQYTRRLKLKPTQLDRFATLTGSFLELWIRYFAEELNRLLRRNPRRRYLDYEEQTPFVRGKLLVERDLDGQSGIEAKYPCRYQIFSEDHPLNQVLKFCNSLLVSETRLPSTRHLLKQNEALLRNVEDRFKGISDIDRIHLTRLEREYEPILELCRLLVSNSTLDLRAGRIAEMAFVFDMNVLYEEFVAEFLRRHKERILLPGDKRLVSAERQVFLGRLFGKFKMKVDVQLQDESGREILLDTKYKRLDASASQQGLSQSDFYQMFAYGKAGKREFEEIVLLYPTSDPVRAVYRSHDLRLYVTHFDPRRIFDVGSASLDVGATVDELNRAFQVLGPAQAIQA